VSVSTRLRGVHLRSCAIVRIKLHWRWNLSWKLDALSNDTVTNAFRNAIANKRSTNLPISANREHEHERERECGFEYQRNRKFQHKFEYKCELSKFDAGFEWKCRELYRQSSLHSRFVQFCIF
jgi:hypothetical protein